MVRDIGKAGRRRESVACAKLDLEGRLGRGGMSTHGKYVLREDVVIDFAQIPSFE